MALELPFSEKEIKDAVFECGSSKAPGPDVGAEQSAFIKDRFTLDGALIVNESIEYLKEFKKKNILFKVDFEKAFDCLNSNFLMEVMKSMSFGSKWRRWILACLQSASISILVNGSPTKEFTLGRGIRQDELKQFASRLECQVNKFTFTYLGLPIGAKMNKLSSWNPVIDKIKSRLSSWKMRSMSFGGRLVLIKSWWFNTDANSLWANVIRSIYGSCGGLDLEGEAIHSLRPSVWKNILVTGRTQGELTELQQLILCYSFEELERDTCSWSLSHNGIYTVLSLSLIIDERLIAVTNVDETMRNNLVPKKLEVFVWRVCKKRLPVKIEIDNRGIDLHSVRCSLCDDNLETVEHSLIFCKSAMDVWDRVFGWWGLGNMTNLSICEILRGNGPSNSTHVGKKYGKRLNGYVHI
ncbi:uncharacterized protein [Rutidosis leptorrhynchoides]|uniref:uncharacterized protein n=1 Tax=Rutidosis leptorrhynchoides TaxID=125765 RepID=UPI003A9A5411